MKNNSSVNIIVLNWNGEKVIIDCLKSLNETNYKNKEIFVIDNASKDTSVELIQNNFPNVKIVSFNKNYKYAKGYNLGFQKIENAEYTIFLNNDTIVNKDFIGFLINQLKKDKSIMQVAPKILYHKSNLIWFAGGKLNLLLGIIYHIGIRKENGINFNKIKQIDFATGCCFAMRSNDFKKIGMFDESFDMYCEDVDLSLRITKFGGKIHYVPQSKIYHNVSHSFGGQKSIKKILLKYKSRVFLVRKHKPFSFPIILIFLSIGFLFEFFFHLRGANR